MQLTVTIERSLPHLGYCVQSVGGPVETQHFGATLEAALRELGRSLDWYHDDLAVRGSNWSTRPDELCR